MDSVNLVLAIKAGMERIVLVDQGLLEFKDSVWSVTRIRFIMEVIVFVILAGSGQDISVKNAMKVARNAREIRPINVWPVQMSAILYSQTDIV